MIYLNLDIIVLIIFQLKSQNIYFDLCIFSQISIFRTNSKYIYCAIFIRNEMTLCETIQKLSLTF